LCRHDRDLNEEQLHTKRCMWLGRHDQDTAHLTSLLPLVQGLPLRLTETVNRQLRLYRGRRCRLLGWAPHPEDVRTEVDGEWMSTKLPLCLYLQFPGATWKLHDDLAVGVYPLAPASRTWKVNKNTGVQARRTGYFVIPDFASTAHMIQGSTLPAVFADTEGMEDDSGSLKHAGESQISSYISFSRVRDKCGIWMMQPFSPFLFRQGSPVGPQILIDKLRNDLRLEDVDDAFVERETAKEPVGGKKKSLMEHKYLCAHCLLEGREPYMHTAIHFGAESAKDIFPKILKEGAWARCLSCQSVAQELRK
jgi:hypothetical protein